jgi:hypothetical protein
MKSIKNKKLFYGITVLFLVGISLFIWNNYQVQVQERPVKPIKLPPAISGVCGIEQCHGLDITCGPNIPDGCTMEMRIDDFCREYVRCEKVDRECRLIKDPKFEECKICIERCNREEDPEKAFQCASKCVE